MANIQYSSNNNSNSSGNTSGDTKISIGPTLPGINVRSETKTTNTSNKK